MTLKPIYIKYGGFLIILFIIGLEISLIFAPFGPITTTIRFHKTWTTTKKTGSQPCVVCGAPADAITYKSNRGGVVTKTKYCRIHAPNTIDSFSSVTSEKPIQIFFGGIFLIYVIVKSLVCLRIIMASESDLLNLRKVWQQYLAFPIKAFFFYLVLSFFFFWAD